MPESAAYLASSIVFNCEWPLEKRFNEEALEQEELVANTFACDITDSLNHVAAQIHIQALFEDQFRRECFR